MAPNASIAKLSTLMYFHSVEAKLEGVQIKMMYDQCSLVVSTADSLNVSCPVVRCTTLVHPILSLCCLKLVMTDTLALTCLSYTCPFVAQGPELFSKYVGDSERAVVQVRETLNSLHTVCR